MCASPLPRKMSLPSVCYSKITDTFWHASFAGFQLIIDRRTGYFNATKLCEAGGKRYRSWFQNKQSRELIQYISTKHGTVRPLAYNAVGGFGDHRETIRGTYVSSDLLLAIASWVSPEFYLNCNRIVLDYFVTEYRAQLMQAESQAKSLRGALHQAANQLNSLSEEVRRKDETLRNIVSEVEPTAEASNLRHVFAIVEKNIDSDKLDKHLSEADTYPFTTIRIQQRNFRQTLKDLHRRYPKAALRAQLPYRRNSSVNLFNYLKENIGYMKTRYNDFKLDNDVSIELFIHHVSCLLQKVK